MRILIVTNHFFPENFRINDLALGLVEKGYDVSVLTGIPNYPEGKIYPGYGFFRNVSEEYRGINIRRVPLIPRGSGSAFRLILNYISSTLSFCILAPWVCRKSYDVIFVFETSPATIGLPAVLLKCLRKTPIVFWVLDLWPDSLTATGALNSKSLLWIIRRIIRGIYKNCDEILISSRGFERSVRSIGGFNGEVKYFPNWVEPQMEKTDHSVENAIDLPKGFRILFTGNIGVAQDFPNILDAADKLKHIKEIQWVIVGSGRQLEWLKSEIVRRGLDSQFHLLGRFPVEMMPHFYGQADALLLPLRKEPIFELTAPGKLQSYMSSGVPVIAALDGEGANIVKEAGCGVACDAGNSQSLSDAVLRVYQMPKSERLTMGENGIKYCEKYFSRSLLFDQIDKLLVDTVASKSNTVVDNKRGNI